MSNPKPLSKVGVLLLVVATILVMGLVWMASAHLPYAPRKIRADLDSLEKRVETLEKR
jgi:hypothetical protein